MNYPLFFTLFGCALLTHGLVAVGVWWLCNDNSPARIDKKFMGFAQQMVKVAMTTAERQVNRSQAVLGRAVQSAEFGAEKAFDVAKRAAKGNGRMFHVEQLPAPHVVNTPLIGQPGWIEPEPDDEETQKEIRRRKALAERQMDLHEAATTGGV